MNNWKTIKKDGLPPIGIPLIVTIKDNLEGEPNELKYPVYYEKNNNGNGYRWGWRYGDFAYDLIPSVSDVLAWMEFPKVYEEGFGDE